VKEIAAPKEAAEPGIGARERIVGEVLEANPDTFVSQTGKANQELGRHPSAFLWKVRPPSGAPDAPSENAAEKETSCDLRPPIKGAGRQLSSAKPSLS
jgi:hypothetical protein